ncbi:MAG: hypothetical protein WED82_01920 [Balneolales bacterium]
MSKKNIFKKIGGFLEDTVRGDNKIGKGLNKVLPAKKLREGIGEVVLGAKDALPVPQKKDSDTRRRLEQAKRVIQEKKVTKEDIKSLDPESLQGMAYQLMDLVDDGRLNKSADELSPELKFKIRLGSSGLVVVYILYAVITGDYTLGELLIYFYS